MKNRAGGLILLAAGLALGTGAESPFFRLPAVAIEDFDDGDVELYSYPGEDADPDSWLLDSAVTHRGSPFALKLYGNTWKLESVGPLQLDSGDVWQVAVYVDSLGEIQGFGLVDSAYALLYAFAGTEQLDPLSWVTVYQGAFPEDTWNLYQLAVGQDWLGRFGYLPSVTAIAFVNDRDSDPHAVSFFDDVLDITTDMPVAPQVEIWYETGAVLENRDGTWSVTVRFFSRVVDPDSPSHDYYWSFGDDSTSTDSNPVHTYVVTDDHEYTVLLEVVDSTGMWGRASCRVQVDPGPTSLPVRMNFVGDIMLARRYELPGGIIDTLGPEGVFEPIRPFLGEAADITVANLECPLTDEGTRHPTKPIVFRGRPTNVAGLACAGIDIVSLANNHVIDYGLEGLLETQRVLDSCGIQHCGAGANLYEAELPVFGQQSGVNVAFLGFSDRTGQYDNYQPYLNAGPNKPGFADQDTFRMFGLIRGLEPVADLVVVQIHAGEEYRLVPEDNDDDESYSPFALMPSLGDTLVRHRTVAAGADLVVCHHPHVLQGFEVFQGKLIAHSLGNFAFDQEYPETYPSVILNAEIDSTGFSRFWLRPVYIDDYIPQRAKDGLGQHILDYLARRSKEFGTYVIVDPDSVSAEIVLDTLGIQALVCPFSAELELAEQAGYWVSQPARLAREGSISSVVGVSPQQNWEFRLGRDVVWMGGFEDEGSTLWRLDHEDEYYDTVACQGLRSLCQVRAQGSGTILTDLEERLVCYSDSTAYTLCVHLRTLNADSVGVEVRCHSSRTGSTPLGTRNLGTVVQGTTGWGFFHNQFVPPDRTGYFDVRLRSRGPESGGQGQAWFDDVGIIEWEDWQPLSGLTRVSSPNDIYWIQARTDVQCPSALLDYQETVYEPQTRVSDRPNPGPKLVFLHIGPNPATCRPVIRYSLAEMARVSLKVYNVLGQEVRTLVEGIQSPGLNQVTWDRLDNQGRELGAGTYFCRLTALFTAQPSSRSEAGSYQASRKLVLTR